MDNHEFRKRAHEVVDWIADFIENIEKYPVKSQVKPKEIIEQLPINPPEQGNRLRIFLKISRTLSYRE